VGAQRDEREHGYLVDQRGQQVRLG